MTAVLSSPVLQAHHEDLQGLLTQLRGSLADGRWQRAAVYAQMCGEHAWLNHSGIFGHTELEQALRSLAARVAPVPPPRTSSAGMQKILHVATQVYGTGGPTQVLSCWIEQDHERQHSVCLTRQDALPVPDKLLRRLPHPEQLHRVDTVRGGLLGRARALRELACRSDLVLIHTHPYDVVPALAFSGIPHLPPVVHVNHADHVFWLGVASAHLVVHMRDSGEALALHRRGVDSSRSTVMARPLRERGRSQSRRAAKRALGVREDQVLLTTAADGAKYRPVASPGFLDLVVPLLAAHPTAVLLAAGPAPSGEWAEASAATAGRVRALGRLSDVTTLHEAADVYLDSFPFSSLTSLMEAGSMGTPVVTYRGHPDGCAVLGSDTRGVDDHMLVPRTAAEFHEQVSQLLTDPDRRSRIGQSTCEAIRATHTGRGWRSDVERLYTTALAASVDVPAVGEASGDAGPLDELVADIMLRTGFSAGVPGVVQDHLGLFPFLPRLIAWMRLARDGHDPRLRQLVPEALRPQLALTLRRAKALRQPQRSGPR